MEPIWMVSVAIIILAALPHQLPIPMTWGLRTNIGRILGLVLALATGYHRPILGMAIAILLISTNMSEYVEGFTQSISKDRVERKQRWTSEEIMLEEPEAIQERSETMLLKDTVTAQDAKPWEDERTLDINPKGVQERTSPDLPFQETEDSQVKNSQ
jgi:hypothetical protein